MQLLQSWKVIIPESEETGHLFFLIMFHFTVCLMGQGQFITIKFLTLRFYCIVHSFRMKFYCHQGYISIFGSAHLVFICCCFLLFIFPPRHYLA